MSTRLTHHAISTLIALFLASSAGVAKAQHISGHVQKTGAGFDTIILSGDGLGSIESVTVGDQIAAVDGSSDTSATVDVWIPDGPVPAPGTLAPIVVKFKNGKSQTLDHPFEWPIGYVQVTGPLPFPVAGFFSCDNSWDQLGVSMNGPVEYSDDQCQNESVISSKQIRKLGTATVSSDLPTFRLGAAFKDDRGVFPLQSPPTQPVVDGTAASFAFGVYLCTVKSGTGAPGPVEPITGATNAVCDNWNGLKGTWQPLGGARLKVIASGGSGTIEFSDMTFTLNKLFDTENLARTLLFNVFTMECGAHTRCDGSPTARQAWAYYALNVVRAPLAQIQLNTLPWGIIYEPPGDQSTATVSFNDLYNTTFTLMNGSGVTNKTTADNSGQISGSIALTVSASEGANAGASAGGSVALGTNWDTTTMTSFGTTKSDSEASQGTTSFTFGNTVGPIASLVPGSGATCPSESSCVPLISDANAYANEPFWQDLFLLTIHPQFAIWEQLAGKRVTVMTGAVPVLGGLTVADLAACATGHGAIPGINSCEVDASDYQIKAANGKDITYDTSKLIVKVTPHEAANLLKLDPFYGAGQSLKSLGVRATTPIASPSYGARAGNDPKSANLNVANTQESTQTSMGTTQYAASVTSVKGNSSSFGLSLGVSILSESLTIGSAEKTTNETDTQVSYSDLTAVSATKTTTANGMLADSDNLNGNDPKGHGPLPQKPSVAVYFDRTFGGFMFVDPFAPGPPALGTLHLQPIVIRELC